ncbi:MAG TPA: hypothetical protein GXZ86_03275 [Clostridiales bacterium]|nr:hypothetical protein [Clostridiales bacterium]
MSVIKYRMQRLKIYVIPFLAISMLFVLGVFATYRLPVEGVPRGVEAWRLSNPSLSRFVGIDAAINPQDYFTSLLFAFVVPLINMIFIRLSIKRLYVQMMERQKARFFFVSEKWLSNIVFSVFVAISFSVLCQHVLISGLYRIAPLVFDQWRETVNQIDILLLQSMLFSFLPTGFYLFSAVFSPNDQISKLLDILFVLWAIIKGLSRLDGASKILKYFTPFSLYSFKVVIGNNLPMIMSLIAATFGFLLVFVSSFAFSRKDFFIESRRS